MLKKLHAPPVGDRAALREFYAAHQRLCPRAAGMQQACARQGSGPKPAQSAQYKGRAVGLGLQNFAHLAGHVAPGQQQGAGFGHLLRRHCQQKAA